MSDVVLREIEADLKRLLERVQMALRASSATEPLSNTSATGLRAPAAALVVVDPGHGGTDPGAVVHDVNGQEVKEKDLVVPYAMALRDQLMSAGYDVILTRSDDRPVGLTDRARIANEARALCFVSIHANAASNAARNGAWVLYDDQTKDADGKALAECIFSSMSKVPDLVDGSPQMEIFPDGSPWVGNRQLTVLSRTQMSAVMVELSFMTNADDLTLLLNPKKRAEVVRAITEGIITWHNRRRA